METVGVLAVVGHQIRTLSSRQALVSGNIANVNTPGYRTVESETFENIASRTKLAMTVTNPDHLGGSRVVAPTAPTTRRGGAVDLEHEMLKASAISREYSLATGVTKSFHRMLLSATRGGS